MHERGGRWGGKGFGAHAVEGERGAVCAQGKAEEEITEQLHSFELRVLRWR